LQNSKAQRLEDKAVKGDPSSLIYPSLLTANIRINEGVNTSQILNLMLTTTAFEKKSFSNNRDQTAIPCLPRVYVWKKLANKTAAESIALYLPVSEFASFFVISGFSLVGISIVGFLATVRKSLSLMKVFRISAFFLIMLQLVL
jgi:hypothetical protein